MKSLGPTRHLTVVWPCAMRVSALMRLALAAGGDEHDLPPAGSLLIIVNRDKHTIRCVQVAQLAWPCYGVGDHAAPD